MFIKDDICYTGELIDEIKALNAESIGKGMMIITFSTGKKRLFDSTLLEGKTFEALQDEKSFRKKLKFLTEL